MESAAGIEVNKEILGKYASLIIKKINEDSIQLPVLPKVASTVFAMVKDPNVGIKQLTDLVHRDQSLVGHVLKIANSAAFAASVRIESLNQAVARIGTKLLGEIALSVTLQGKFYKVPGFEEIVKDLLRHSLTSGMYGEIIAPLANIKSEIQFMCGLLHNVGKPLVLNVISDIDKELNLKIPHDLANILIEKYNVDMGNHLADKWDLPDFIIESIKFQKSFKDAPIYSKEAAMCVATDTLADWAMEKNDVSEEDILESSAFAYLGFDQGKINHAIRKKDKVMDKVLEMEF